MHFFTYLVINCFLEGFEDIKILNKTWMAFPNHRISTHSSVLAWRIPGTGEPGGLPSMGLHRVGHD